MLEEPEVDDPAQWLGVHLNRLATRLPLPHLKFLDLVRKMSVVIVIDASTGT
jgi:hypothetical protein